MPNNGQRSSGSSTTNWKCQKTISLPYISLELGDYIWVRERMSMYSMGSGWLPATPLPFHPSNDMTLNIILHTIASVLSGSELMSGISPLNRAANSSSESLLKLGELKSLWLEEVECGDSGCSVAATVPSSTDVPGSCRTDGGWYTERRSSPLDSMEGCGTYISVLWSGWNVPLGKPAISHGNDHKPLLCQKLFPRI
jgi:hypothetical protein